MYSAWILGVPGRFWNAVFLGGLVYERNGMSSKEETVAH